MGIFLWGILKFQEILGLCLICLIFFFFLGGGGEEGVNSRCWG